MSQCKLITALIVGLSAVGMSAVASAAAPGFYVGLQGGYGDTHYKHPVDSTVLTGRGSFGYQFDQNFAVEAGYTQFNKMKVSNQPNAKVEQHAIDVFGKGILPLSNNFSLYGKVGAAYVDLKETNSFGATFTDNKFLPAFGAGVGYDLTPNVPVSIGWERIQKVGHTDAHSPIKSSDFFYAGVAYNFG
jgi:OmpA-OmpF porin, OOP family